MSASVYRGGIPPGGGLKGYPVDRLYEEIAFLAYYFHWDHDLLMNMEHQDRKRWCREVSEINRKLGSDDNEKSIESLL